MGKLHILLFVVIFIFLLIIYFYPFMDNFNDITTKIMENVPDKDNEIVV